ncbi:ATP-dependent helicase [Nocardia transvalensis]|uniref:ATP-dependent helicase n=1 Tax=Nocardia transvalensis TaxID=37333 RepID=UPI0018963663|nr:ATP-dependent DNA helicase [Nocardia transvalensis]MBF6327084.1 PD-(D/E)XK nuclease family protein [Nocardia transvalensis]
MRSDSSVRLVRRGETAPRLREWGADVRTLFASGGVDPGWRPWQVLGGPGTGKTSLLVDVAADRIADGDDPESVLVLTHSKAAALRVRNAITRQLASPHGGVPGATREPLVRTVHSYAFAILRMHAATHGNPPPRLLTGAEQDVVLREMLRGELEDIARGAEELWPQRLQPALGTIGFAEQLRDLMLRATERGLGPEDLVELGRLHDRPEWEAAGRFLERYEQAMLLRWSVGIEAPEATAPALDAAELVGAALDALLLDRALLDAERDRIRCLLVDDAQHLDPLAAQLVRAIGGGPATTVVAGDPDQAVFTFRGADSHFVADLDAPAERRIILRDNRRSAAAVHGAVARISARLPALAPHRFEVDDTADGAAGEVQVRVLTTPAKEAALIADHLRRAHLTDGVPWSQMAVVVRSVPLSLAPLRRALLAAGVPVQQPKPDVPLARRRGAAWMLLSLRALLSGERARPDIFTDDDALDLLTGPLGGADQISLRRLRRGIRRTLLERAPRRPEHVDPREATADPWADDLPTGGDPPVVSDPGTAGNSSSEPRTTENAEDAGGEDGDGAADANPEVSDGNRGAVAVGDRQAKSGSERRRESSVDDDFAWEAVDSAWSADLDRSSAEVLRDLVTGVGDFSILERLTEVEAAPLRRVLKAVARARRAWRRGAGLEDVLWALWTGSNLEKRWVGQSERGGAVGMQADRDLDAAVGLFDAAAAYVDRLPRATVEGFVEYLEQQEIPQDSAPLTDPGEAVAIVSAHAAAGREWEVVAVAGVQEGIWPNLRPRGTLLGVEDLVDLVGGVSDSGERVSRAAPILAEERRLLLLACSRARRSLLVTAVESVSGDRDLVPSRFLAELDPQAAPGESGRIPAPVDPGRALVMQALIAELRSVACDPEDAPDRRQRAAQQLARLARAGVRGAHPDDWYGTAAVSSQLPLWDDEQGPVSLSPSTVELLKTCPLRWALERHGGSDGDNPHAVKGNLVHTLVQALAGQVTEAQVKAALVRAWKAIDPTSGDTGPHSWHSRQELRRTESMLDTFLAWLRNTRTELTQLGVEVPVDCVLPARGPDEYPVRIRGRVDRVERDALGRFVIVDVKTGKTPITKQAAQDHAQLATYQVAAAAGALDDGSADAEPGGARLVYVAKPNSKEGATQRLQTPLDEEGIDQWRGTIHEAAAATRGPSYLAMRNDGCRHCSVSGSCPVQDSGRQVTDT